MTALFLRNRAAVVVVTALAALLLLAGCDNKGSSSGLATARVQIGNKTFTLEVADTRKARTYGLMRRDSMPEDRGMIFVFDREAPLSFWMENTRIPLDIVYLDSSGRVVSVKQMKPFDLTGVPSDGPAQYAIELNKGAADAAGVKAGMTLQLPTGLKAKD